MTHHTAGWISLSLASLLWGCTTDYPSHSSSVATSTTSSTTTTVLAAGSKQTTPLPSYLTTRHATESTASLDGRWYVVDCLLPPQSRKMGRSFTYLTPPRPAKMPAIDCEIRGGEYVDYDRANIHTALAIWLEQAESGDANAQYYVGQIYAQGSGSTPNYAQAGAWYQRAAQQGHQRAQMQLGHLYEAGLGVVQDPEQALKWYRAATGLADDQLAFASSIQHARLSEHERLAWAQEKASLQQQLEHDRSSLTKLKQQYADLQRSTEQASQSRLHQIETKIAAQQQKITGQAKKSQLPAITILSPVLSLDGVRPTLHIPPGTTEQSLIGRVSAGAGIKTFSINNAAFPLDEQLGFWASLPIQSDVTPVTITLIDQQDRMAQFHLSMRQPIAASQPIPSVTHNDNGINNKLGNGRSIALIVGNHEYDAMPDLPSAQADSLALSDLLENRYGFETHTLQNATRTQFMKQLYLIQQQLQAQDNLLIFYAGHGEYDQREQQGHWLFTDAEYDDPSTWLANDQISALLEHTPAQRVMVISDSCYSDMLSQHPLLQLKANDSTQSGLTLSEDETALSPIIANTRVRTLLTANITQLRQTTAPAQRSAFTTAILGVLDTNQKPLDSHSLFVKVFLDLQQQSSLDESAPHPLPIYAPIKDAGHEVGDFYFNPIERPYSEQGLAYANHPELEF